MPDFHAEPYIYLPAISHKSVLVAWGAFYFRTKKSGEMKIVEAKDLKHLHPPREDTIGARSRTYGDATVTVRDSQGGAIVATGFTNSTNHSWITGLEPDTEYTYTVTVNGETWAEGERWNWSPEQQALVQGGRYDNRFRTNPDPAKPSPRLTFAVIGDFGVGMRKISDDRKQFAVANALRLAVDNSGVRFVLTTGDNIYASKNLLGLPVGDTGEHDDDWFFTYFQPYRYVINRVCVYPSIGNHDTGESEDNDDRAQVEDNFYVKLRTAGEEGSGRASLDPGLFYRFKYGADVECVCVDTSKENFFADRLFEHPKHQDFLEQSFPAGGSAPRWLIPFCHHPPFCAGPRHHNTTSMHARLLPMFARAGVKAVFSGHEHNFQHSATDGIHYLVTGAAAKFRPQAPDRFAEARTQSWSSECHFLLVDIAAGQMTVRAVGELAPDGTLRDIQRRDPAGNPVAAPIVIKA